MIRFSLLFVVLFFYLQVQGQYTYDEQRQKEANNYLESIKRGRDYSSIKTSEFKMNDQAVQEMVNRWNGKSAEQDAEKMKSELERRERMKQ